MVVSWDFISACRAPSSWLIAPINSLPTSICNSSIGSFSTPSSVIVTTCGRPTSNSKPSRRMVSIKTLKCNSPRPEIVKPIPFSSTRSATLVSSSRFNRSPICLDVVNSPSRPFIGLVFGPRYILRVGASMSIVGSASGCSLSAIVSPICASATPTSATMSPAKASSSSSRFKPR